MRVKRFITAIAISLCLASVQGKDTHRLFEELFNFPLRDNPYFIKTVSGIFKENVTIDESSLYKYIDGDGKTCKTMGNLDCGDTPIYCTGYGVIDCLPKCPASAESFNQFMDVMTDKDFNTTYPEISRIYRRIASKSKDSEEKFKEFMALILENCNDYPAELLAIVRFVVGGVGDFGDNVTFVSKDSVSGFGDYSYDYYDEDYDASASTENEIDPADSNDEEKIKEKSIKNFIKENGPLVLEPSSADLSTQTTTVSTTSVEGADTASESNSKDGAVTESSGKLITF